MQSARDGILTHGPNSKLRLSKNSLQKMVLYTCICRTRVILHQESRTELSKATSKKAAQANNESICSHSSPSESLLGSRFNQETGDAGEGVKWQEKRKGNQVSADVSNNTRRSSRSK